ncbi:hypothetical protein MLD38_021257 [Melastoma candidum]|uniref:Uncharacterized protein n=1 Tax=Melastoma candidum TaxID=119954 RepID=A0ACB9QNN0_9MYRT|nr:hypothetical protein MLD38_021257 [Melastoma candidum]
MAMSESLRTNWYCGRTIELFPCGCCEWMMACLCSGSDATPIGTSSPSVMDISGWMMACLCSGSDATPIGTSSPSVMGISGWMMDCLCSGSDAIPIVSSSPAVMDMSLTTSFDDVLPIFFEHPRKAYSDESGLHC